jgi:hypothetical protein
MVIFLGLKLKELTAWKSHVASQLRDAPSIDRPCST